MQYSHATRRMDIHIFPDAVIKHSHFNAVLRFCDADALAKITDRRRTVSAPAHAGYGGHAGIVPTLHIPFADKFGEFAFAHHRVLEIETRELDLLRMAGHRYIVQYPV